MFEPTVSEPPAPWWSLTPEKHMNRLFAAALRVAILSACLFQASCQDLATMLPTLRPTPQPKYVIVAFGAEWCEACLKNRPALEKLNTPPSRQVRYVDVDKEPEIADDYGIKTVPMYVVWERKRFGYVEIGRTSDIGQLSRMVAR